VTTPTTGASPGDGVPTTTEAAQLAGAVLDAVEHAVVGKRDVLELVLAGILTRGHVLLEDLPGVAKTLLARSFATATGGTFRRVQFTPDLLPGDVTGGPVLTADGRVVFQPGPVFANLVLADEINRAPPKVQSALLEAMQEGQVSADGETHPLPRPFTLLATQNAVDFEGTYPLPEAQLDRFRLRVAMGYPADVDERALVTARLERGRDEVDVPVVTDPAGLLALQEAVEHVHVDASVTDYVVSLVRATREEHGVEVGASPRGSLGLVLAARARALLAGRGYVVPDDVVDLAVPTLAHRIVLRPDQWVRGVRPATVVEAVLAKVPAPPAVRPTP